MSLKEYCPCCSIYEVEEYDPETNWVVPELVGQFAEFKEPEATVVVDVKSVLKAIETKKAIEVFVSNFTGDLFNTSASFILSKGKFRVTKDSKFIAHSILRKVQLASLNLSEEEFARVRVSRDIVSAVRNYDKSLYNLSPVWALKLARKRNTFGNIAEAMKAIENEL